MHSRKQIGRRGFLGALTGLVSGAVLDPELALWKPGKLISIPKPFTPVQIGCDFLAPFGLTASEFELMYLRPAMMSIAESIDYKGYHNYKLLDLPLPVAVEESRHIRHDILRGKGLARYIVSYDGVRDRHLHHVDVLVAPGRA